MIPEENWDQKISDIKEYGISLFAMGDDREGEFDLLKEHCDVSYLSRTRDISTTQLKKSLTNFLSTSKEDIAGAFKVIEALKNDFD